MPEITFEQVSAAFEEIYHRIIAESQLEEGLLLAHYTSIAAMESILQHDEIWFSNPLFMNDLQEMRFGLNEGSQLFSNPELLKIAGGTESRAKILLDQYMVFFHAFDNNEAFDIYVFCLSKHKKSDEDGRLSMWRGYGGHGSGVAMVFDTSSITIVPSSPLIFAKVQYASDAARREKMKNMFDKWAQTVRRLNLPDENLYMASYIALEILKVIALTSKHVGFSEEEEWRVIYLPKRDTSGILKQFLSYRVGQNGVEPKLKFKVGHIEGVSASDLTLERILHSIILGPSNSSPLARRSVQRMLEAIQKPRLTEKVRTSGIPLRPQSGSSF